MQSDERIMRNDQAVLEKSIPEGSQPIGRGLIQSTSVLCEWMRVTSGFPHPCPLPEGEGAMCSG